MSAAEPSRNTPAAVTRIERLRAHQDARGIVFEPLDVAELAVQRNVHVVLTQPGEVRGNHAHLRATEITTVVGPCLVRLKEGAQLRDIEVPGGETWRFVIPPGVVHAFRNPGPAPLVTISFSTEVHDPTGSDARREQIL